ncbi:MAG: hypothetical protein Q8N35_17510 [Methylococcaceae bacterium]|nr:hypothetical protein [Methylococcaceae bacterium]MDZ4155216.1 hypothetical protein [Methylococcales bacterium]MDP2393512.1 hypothetical protein [Methylococcaceae bacterium]MDP3021382.1 hypothetical protein [Methylococcaceae bacterium]MDP3391027.1 hypothetical protein [Methylococcaceae bacterium]
MSATQVYSDVNHLVSCQSYSRLTDLNLQQPPQRVLLVPLLSKEPHSTEGPRWSEQPARTLEAFYRKRFNAKVEKLRDIWNWTDYYRQIEQMAQQSQPFDRIVFISHGGFDGPVLTNALFEHELQVTGNRSKLVLFSEEQPGLRNVLSITYDTDKNPVFNDYLAAHWSEFVDMEPTDVWHQLKGLEKQVQPLDNGCFQRYCSPDKLPASPLELREAKLNLCELICREPLFEQKTSVEIYPERFFKFTKTLSSLVTSDGLIFFGACNPGSAAPVKLANDKIKLLINSTLVGGPHNSYVHLVSAVTGRITAGPIGSSSAKDIVDRVIMFESGHPQRNLCIVTPTVTWPQ